MRTIDETTEFTGETPSRLDGSGLTKGGWPFASALRYFRRPFTSAELYFRPAFVCVVSYFRLPAAGKPLCCKAVKVFFPFR